MCRSRRGRRKCVFTFWEKGGGFSGQTLGGGSWGEGIYASSSSFGLPPFLLSLLLSRFAGFLPGLFFLFVFSDFHFLLSPIRDGRWKGEGGDSGGLSFVFSSVPSSQKKTILSSPSLLHSIRLFFPSFFFSDGGGGGGGPPPLSPPRPVPRLRHIFHLCQKEGKRGEA